MKNLVLFTSTSSSEATNSNGLGSMDSLKQLFSNPVLYIVVGVLVALLIVIYFIKRFVKAKPNTSTIIIRKGRVRAILDEKNQTYFLVPFIDSIGAIVSNEEKEFSSDKLFINNGPDSLYKISYTLKYKITNLEGFYQFINTIDNLLPTKLNDELRFYADKGNALVLIKEYRDNIDVIINVINQAVKPFSIEVTDFKINIIEPIGQR